MTSSLNARELDRGAIHPAWDRFTAEVAGAAYQQTLRWAEVKATLGWRPAHVLLHADGDIEAGCQILCRTVARVGTIAYVPRGPLTRTRDRALAARVLDAVEEFGRSHRALCLKVQPPPGDDLMVRLLEQRGFVPSNIQAATVATTRLDLDLPVEQLFRGLSRTRRKDLRRAWRRGVVARVGTESDMEDFVRLLGVTAARQSFTPYPPVYYHQMFRSFAAGQHARLFVVEAGGRQIAGQLVLAYGDTVTAKVSAWSGEHADLYPNEVLDWTSIQWAKERGYHYLDMDGIRASTAAAVLAGDRVSPSADYTTYKLRFGGEVVIHPGAYDSSYHPLLKRRFRSAGPWLERLLLSRWGQAAVTQGVAGPHGIAEAISAIRAQPRR